MENLLRTTDETAGPGGKLKQAAIMFHASGMDIHRKTPVHGQSEPHGLCVAVGGKLGRRLAEYDVFFMQHTLCRPSQWIKMKVTQPGRMPR